MYIINTVYIGPLELSHPSSRPAASGAVRYLPDTHTDYGGKAMDKAYEKRRRADL